MHGVKGIRGEVGHKGDRGPLGLPVSTDVHPWGISSLEAPLIQLDVHINESLVF